MHSAIIQRSSDERGDERGVERGFDVLASMRD